MGKTKILTKKNQFILYTKLTDYLKEVLDDEENFSTFEDLYQEAERALENGYKEGLTLDRINVNGNYEPSNCRWINIKEQQSNRRSCKFITYKGKTQCMKNWCKELNLNYNRIKNRFRICWSIERAFEE